MYFRDFTHQVVKIIRWPIRVREKRCYEKRKYFDDNIKSFLLSDEMQGKRGQVSLFNISQKRHYPQLLRPNPHSLDPRISFNAQYYMSTYMCAIFLCGTPFPLNAYYVSIRKISSDRTEFSHELQGRSERRENFYIGRVEKNPRKDELAGSAKGN